MSVTFLHVCLFAAWLRHELHEHTPAIRNALADALVEILGVVPRKHLELARRAVKVDERRAEARQEARTGPDRGWGVDCPLSECDMATLTQSLSFL